MGLLKDIWRVGWVKAPLVEVLADPGRLAAARWLPEQGPLRFLADPFGLWRDGRLHLFVEAYDYRDRHGVIEALVLDEGLEVVERRVVLKEPWHLSYPFVFEAEGETWMAPEGFRSGVLTLYRAVAFPFRWEAAHRIELEAAPIDATPVFHEGRWWLFYTPASSKADKVGALHLAYADRLAGPWTPHPGNPVRYDPAGSRPGGTPLVAEGVLTLPVQDCSRTYGGAIRPLRIHTLTPTAFAAEAGAAIGAPAGFAPYRAGLHTLSAAGDVTLLDAKRQVISPASLALDLGRRLAR